MPGTSLEDMELVERARDGDVAAFGALVRRYQDRVHNLAYRMLGNAEDAADVAQETFLAAYEGLDGFRAESALYTWLYRIAVNKALGRRRTRSTIREVSVDGPASPLETTPDWSDGPVDSAERNERAEIVQTAIGALSDELKAVVLMRDIEGLEYEEIAEALGVPLGTVKSRLHRARLELKGALQQILKVAP